MEETKNVKAEEPQKISYEQLEQIAHQLSETNKQLYSKLQESNIVNMCKRLEFLFKVIENKESFNEEFISKCTEEIVTIITIPEEPEEEK